MSVLPSMRTLANAINAFRELDAEIQPQTILAYLYVAGSKEPVPMRDLQTRLGVASSSASRNVALLSKLNRYGKPGHDLVEIYENPEDRRYKLVRLTSRGRTLPPGWSTFWADDAFSGASAEELKEQDGHQEIRTLLLPLGRAATNCAAAWMPASTRTTSSCCCSSSTSATSTPASPTRRSPFPKGASFKDMVALKGKPDIGDQINKKIIGPLANGQQAVRHAGLQRRRPSSAAARRWWTGSPT